MEHSSSPRSFVCEKCWKTIFDTQAWQDFCTLRPTRSMNFSYRITTDSLCPKICEWCSLIYNQCCRQKNYLDPRGALSKLHLMIELYWEEYNYVTPKTHALLQVRMVRLHSATEDYPMGVFSSETLALEADEQDPAAVIIPGRRRHAGGEPFTLKRSARAMLEACDRHQECNAKRISELPTRVIDVGPKFGSAHVSLFQTDGRSGTYLALSYTWGSRNNDQSLTTKSSPEWKRKMAIASLPQTIQDTIYVARLLDTQYVWVDALCIIQDSDADKNHEIPRMLDIYGNAAVVLVAACAADAAHGFLRESDSPIHGSSVSQRNHDCDFHLNIPIRIATGLHGLVKTSCLPKVTYDESVEPVNARAWTLQEQVLAKRCLIFNSNSVQWRCGAGTVNLDKSIYLPSNHHHNKAGSSLEELSQPVSDNPTLALIQWLHTVEVYSHRALSMSKDRLTAISGLARKFAPYIESEYLAGIWSRHVLHQLCWTRDDTSDHRRVSPCVISNSYRAPSWSWASTDTGVEFILPQQNFVVMYNMRFWWQNEPESIIWPECKVVDRIIQYQHDDPFGDAKTACLTIRTTCREAWVIPSLSMLLWRHNGDTVFETASQATERTQHLIDAGNNGFDSQRKPHEIYPSRCYRMDRFGQDGTALSVLCIALLCNSSQVFGLLIQRTDQHWKRVGMFHNFEKADFEGCGLRDLRLE